MVHRLRDVFFPLFLMSGKYRARLLTKAESLNTILRSQAARSEEIRRHTVDFGEELEEAKRRSAQLAETIERFKRGGMANLSHQDLEEENQRLLQLSNLLASRIDQVQRQNEVGKITNNIRDEFDKLLS